MADVVVVGAGPAGLMAAIAAAGRGASVLVLEQLARPGRKLLASGGGRCNLTNTLPPEEFAARLGRDGRFALPALGAFGAPRLRGFLRARGVPTRVENGLRVYPSSSRAGDVEAALLAECRGLDVAIQARTVVRGLDVAAGAVSGVISEAGPVPARSVIVATGGLGYPELGGSDTGYALARSVGHTVVRPVPGLVGIVTAESWLRGCAGVSLEGARVAIEMSGRREAAEGDLLFTHAGISGQAALDVSGSVSEILTSRDSVPMSVSLMPSMRRDEWARRLEEWRTRSGGRLLPGLVAELLPRSLARLLCRQAGVDALRAGQLPRAAGDALVRLLARTPITAVGTGGFERAMVTRGGVHLREVDPATLESRRLAGLHFAGEVLDIDGPTGGFNLQWAFSSGWLAGAGVRFAEGGGAAGVHGTARKARGGRR